MGVVVTGAQGFVGLNLTRTLAEQGNTVYAVGRRSPDDWVQRYLQDVAGSVRHRVADLSSPGSLAAALTGDQFERFIHAAVVTSTTTEVEREESLRIVSVNIGGTMQALDVARNSGIRRFVYVSSPSAIGAYTGDSPVPETVSLNPDSLYGISKMSSEALVRRYGALHELSTVSVRIAQPYGPGERATPSRVRTSPIYEWLADAGRDATLPTGPLARQRDWTYIADTASGIVRLAIADSLQHDLYNLGTGRQTEVGEVIQALRGSFPDLSIDENPSPEVLNPNISGPSRPPLDVRRFSNEFGWSPAIGIAEGMDRYIQWWKTFSR